MSRKRGGFLTLSGNAQTALSAVNKSVDDIVREHLTRDELDELCDIWNVEPTEGRTHDADRVLKRMHSQPTFVNHMAMLALGTRGLAIAGNAYHQTADPWLNHKNKDMELHDKMRTFHQINSKAFVTGPLTYGLRYLYGKYKDSTKSTDTIRILLTAIERLKRSARKRVSTRRR